MMTEIYNKGIQWFGSTDIDICQNHQKKCLWRWNYLRARDNIKRITENEYLIDFFFYWFLMVNRWGFFWQTWDADKRRNAWKRRNMLRLYKKFSGQCIWDPDRSGSLRWECGKETECGNKSPGPEQSGPPPFSKGGTRKKMGMWERRDPRCGKGMDGSYYFCDLFWWLSIFTI